MREGSTEEKQPNGEGKKKLLKNINEEEIVVFPTYKSGKFAILSVEEYKKAALKHLEKDSVVEWEEVEKTENLLNRHSKDLQRIFCIGAVHGHEGRMQKAYKAVDLATPTTYFLVKDHKKAVEGEVVPPTRPVCGAQDGPNSRISSLLSILLTKVADLADRGTE